MSKSRVKYKIEGNKGAASTIIMLVVGLMVLLGLTALLGKGTVSADPLSILQCIIAGGKDCQAEKGAEEASKKDSTASIRDAVRCAYLVCFDKDKFYCGNKRLLEGLSWGSTNCFKHFCKDTTKPKICDEDSQRNPIIISQALEKPEFIPVFPLDKPLDKMFVNRASAKCGVDWGSFLKLGDEILVDVRIDERLLANQNVKEDCDRTSLGTGFGKDRGPGNYGSPQKECRLKSDADIYVYHQEYIYDRASRKFAHIVTLCSERTLFATKEGTPKGPVTLFEDSEFKGSFFDISEDTPNVENVKNFEEISSVKLASNYGVILYEKPDYEGGCRTFFDSVTNLGSVGFNDKTKSAIVSQGSFKGAILYDKPLKIDGKVDQSANNEYHPNKGEVVYLKTKDCVHQKAQSIEVSTDSVAVLYEDTELLFVTDKTTNLPQFARKATHIKVCKKDPKLPLEKNTCLKEDEKFSLNKDLPK